MKIKERKFNLYYLIHSTKLTIQCVNFTCHINNLLVMFVTI